MEREKRSKVKDQSAKQILIFVLWVLILSPVFAVVPHRLISGTPAITEMLFALDLNEQIAGVTTNCNYPPAALRKPKVGGFFLNLEKVISLKPDLVIMDKDAQDKDIKKFRHYKLNVYVVNPKTIKGVMKTILELGKATGKEESSKIIVGSMEKRIEKVQERVKNFRPNLMQVLTLWNPGVVKRKALVIVGMDPLVVAGGGNFINDILNYAGVENVAGQAWTAYPQYSFEKLVSENPQYIIIPSNLISRRQIESDKRWQSLEAVRTGRILFINADILSRPGPRVVGAIEQIADFIYH
ncbi:MAG: ABC transporter substrate-binding protein [Candidatus Margulisbacteria bacterium]|nr:ABC transporter substrate-binding protein [Candidatus Margulisiibacteriota bacterium]